jgi:ABC-type oligopeptide transport system substrate-binding subunit
MERYEGWWAGIQDTWDQAINGEIHPWTSQENHDTNIFMVTRELMFGDHGWTRDNPSGYENHWEEHFKNPDNVAVSGAWQPTSVNGSQSIDFEPNPEYVNADQVNFDKLKLVRRQSGRASRSALNANSQDYYAGDVPSHIAQSFPDDISQRFVPNNSGLAFQAKHTHPLFANRESRRAIQYAIDTERLAQSVHQTKFDPVSIPGGHGYTTRQTLGDDFVDNTLETYPRDLEKAGSLMQDAGFSREGGQWVDGDGDPLSIEITTPAETPTLEPTFASQLRSFGIQANLQTLSGANFQDQLTNAELDCWPTQNGANLGVGFALRIARTFQQVIVLEERYKQTRWYPQEQFDATDYAETGIITPANDAGHSEYSMRAPPVGEPGGANQEYKTALLAWNAYRAKSVEEYTESLRQLSWVFNRLMPMFPVANANIQTFVDDGHWIWPPENSDRWQGVNTEALQGEHLMASANVFADPENPESGASVDE